MLQGSAPDTTNNRMELVAAIEGLRALKRACQVTVLTDSDYVSRGITEFLARWKMEGKRMARRVRDGDANRITNGVTRWRTRLLWLQSGTARDLATRGQGYV